MKWDDFCEQTLHFCIKRIYESIRDGTIILPTILNFVSREHESVRIIYIFFSNVIFISGYHKYVRGDRSFVPTTDEILYLVVSRRSTHVLLYKMKFLDLLRILIIILFFID